MDLFTAIPYLAHVMLRRLLTLLAVITGLAASGASAEMRFAGVEQVRLEAALDQASACAVSAGTTPAEPAAARVYAADSVKLCPRPVTTIVIPTILFGPDRARE
jgi:hypothetical protein